MPGCANGVTVPTSINPNPSEPSESMKSPFLSRPAAMPNLFSKITSQNGEINLFAGGRQIKSLVPLIDVARCFKFMEEKNDISFQTFNLTKDTLSVKEVANICKKYNSKVSLKETNDEGTPSYRKHKIYLYKEGFNNFKEAFESVSKYIIKEKGEEIISDKKNEKQDEVNFSDNNSESSSKFTEVNFDDLGKD